MYLAVDKSSDRNWINCYTDASGRNYSRPFLFAFQLSRRKQMARKIRQLKIEWPDRSTKSDPANRRTTETGKETIVTKQDPNTTKPKLQRIIEARCTFLSPEHAKRYRDLEERFTPLNDLPGLDGQERNEYYQLREMAVARQSSQNRRTKT